MFRKRPRSHKHPAGIWRCTHSTFSEFVVGQEYPCLPLLGSHRIYPVLRDRGWSPYWEPFAGRFCYPAADLDFVFVRALPKEDMDALIRERDGMPEDAAVNRHYPGEFTKDERRPLRHRFAALRKQLAGFGPPVMIFLAGMATSAAIQMMT